MNVNVTFKHSDYHKIFYKCKDFVFLNVLHAFHVICKNKNTVHNPKKYLNIENVNVMLTGRIIDAIKYKSM